MVKPTMASRVRMFMHAHPEVALLSFCNGRALESVTARYLKPPARRTRPGNRAADFLYLFFANSSSQLVPHKRGGRVGRVRRERLLNSSRVGMARLNRALAVSSERQAASYSSLLTSRQQIPAGLWAMILV